jgi:hypothetical protein
MDTWLDQQRTNTETVAKVAARRDISVSNKYGKD